MARLTVVIADDLNDRFRGEAGKRFGAKKSSLQKATTEALELWLKQAETEAEK